MFFWQLVDWRVVWICHKILKAHIQAIQTQYPLDRTQVCVGGALSREVALFGFFRHWRGVCGGYVTEWNQFEPEIGDRCPRPWGWVKKSEHDNALNEV